MTGTALALVLAAAFLHAFWNYLAKKSLHKIAFIWWFILFAVIFYYRQHIQRDWKRFLASQGLLITLF
jgi:hypothetical protein